MIVNKSVLLYNLYPLNFWRNITDEIFSNVPHDDIIVHITIPKRNPIGALRAYQYLKKNTKVKNIFFSLNFKTRGESHGFDILRKRVNFDEYSIASYTHSKGSSRKRKNTQPIKDWTALLKYFIVERLDLARVAFDNGYYLYGVSLTEGQLLDRKGNVHLANSLFYYPGNFVTINLVKLRNRFLNAECLISYYGVEVFWGTLCEFEKAYCVHQSNTKHYEDMYPENIYKNN